jgi:protein gp37
MRWEGKKHWGAGAPRYRTSLSNWAQPRVWNRKAEKDGKPHRVFCASLADVFDNEVPQAWRNDLWELICDTPHLEWLVVTKRIGNVEKMGGAMLLKTTPNTRLIVTVCNQEEADRDIPKLLALPCKNGVSYEPALAAVDWRPWLAHQYQGGHDTGGQACDPCSVCGVFTNGLHHPYARGVEWIIIGGESAQGGALARPFDLAWARSTIAQCKAAGVQVFMKQFGANIGWNGMQNAETCWPGATPNHEDTGQGYWRVHLKDRAGADPAEWPADLRVRGFPI